MYAEEQHYNSIDLLRGLAAIVILIYHYFAFFHPGVGEPLEWAQTDQPFYSNLSWIYLHGKFAVQFFWIISGFVFAHVYAGSTISAYDFGIRRFARLYPLHLLTLLVIAIIQIASLRINGTTQVIGNHDLKHFFRNLFFIPSGWGYKYSFNSPIWSVQIEAIIYAVYWFLCATIFRNGIILPSIAAVSFALAAFTGDIANLIALCGAFFFVGVVLYRLQIIFKDDARTLLTVTFIVCWCGFYLVVNTPGWSTSPLYFAVPMAFSPPLVLAAAMIDRSGLLSRQIRSLKWIGDATYSIYLWHFPIQVLALTALNYFNADRAIFTSPLALVAWVAGMLWLSHLSFRYLEKPMQKWCLQKFAKRDGAIKTQPAS